MRREQVAEAVIREPGRLAPVLLALVACQGPPAPAAPTPLATPAPTPLPPPDPPGSSDCPRTSPPRGEACASLDRECTFTSGASCVCTRSRCVTPAGPIPNCTSTLVWECRDDGCPMRFSAPCTQEGKTCSADDGMCSVSFACKAGRWTTVPDTLQCRPAAPPRR